MILKFCEIWWNFISELKIYFNLADEKNRVKIEKMEEHESIYTKNKMKIYMVLFDNYFIFYF